MAKLKKALPLGFAGDLVKVLAPLHRVTRSSPQPILACVWMVRTEESLILRATDLTTYVRTQVDVGEAVDGDEWHALLPFDRLIKVLKGFPKGATVCGRLEGGNVFRVECNGGTYRFPTDALPEYPVWPKYGEIGKHLTTVEVRKDHLNVVAGFISKDARRSKITFARLSWDKHGVRMAATNGKRIVLYEIDSGPTSEERAMLIPGPTMEIVKGFALNCDVRFFAGNPEEDTWSMIQTDEFTVAFPAFDSDKCYTWDEIAQAEASFTAVLTLTREEIEGAIRRFGAIGDSDATLKIGPIDVTDGTCSYAWRGESRDSECTFEEEIDVESVDGHFETMAFDPKLLLGCVKAVAKSKDSLVRIRIVSYKNPVQIEGDGVPIRSMLMPLTIRNEPPRVEDVSTTVHPPKGDDDDIAF